MNANADDKEYYVDIVFKIPPGTRHCVTTERLGETTVLKWPDAVRVVLHEEGAVIGLRFGSATLVSFRRFDRNKIELTIASLENGAAEEIFRSVLDFDVIVIAVKDCPRIGEVVFKRVKPKDFNLCPED